MGSQVTCTPANAKGGAVVFKYTGLPDSNNQFGPKYVKAALPKYSVAESVMIKAYFPKTATNHPASGGQVTPNWYYYWGQTLANYGTHLYSGGNCTDTTIGYYTFGESNFHVCDSASGTRILPCLSQFGWPYDGIDLFASNCRHEERHLQDYFAWWDSSGVNIYNRNLDSDTDWVKNSFEPFLTPWLDSTKWSTYDDSLKRYSDFEYRGRIANCDWYPGTADSLDWADPGQQH